MDWGREEGFPVAVAYEPPWGEGAFGKVKNGQGECGDGGVAWQCVEAGMESVRGVWGGDGRLQRTLGLSGRRTVHQAVAWAFMWRKCMKTSA